MHKTSVLRMEEAFMVGARDSENQETKIDKPKASGSAMQFFPWFEALKFSLRVMRKSFFKLFIPSMALSFVMGGFHVLLAYALLIVFDNHYGTLTAINGLIMILIMVLFQLPVYAYLYPLLKRFVMFQALQELNPFLLNAYNLLSRRIRYRFFLRLIKISLKRYSFQTIAFLVLLFPPIINLMFNQSGLDIVILFSLVSLWPLAMSYYNYFFAELSTIDEMIRETNPDFVLSANPILPRRKLFWPVVSWKAILFVVYIVSFYALPYFGRFFVDHAVDQSVYMFIGRFFKDFFSYFSSGLSESVSPVLNISLLFVRFPSFWFNTSGSDLPLWVYLFFILLYLLLFGLLTAFFFLVETLSSIYFYHRCRGNSMEEPTEKNEASMETDRGKPINIEV